MISDGDVPLPLSGLAAYSDELIEVMVAFVDKEDGRDAPLTAADEAKVRRLIKDRQSVCEQVDGLRTINSGLNRILDDVTDVDVPSYLFSMTRDHQLDDS